METVTDKIKKLQSQIDSFQQEIKKCKHIWGKTKYDPETVKEPVFSHYIPHGSDPEPVYNYNDKTIPRWSRKCEVCGKTEYTYKEEVISVKKEPKFND